MIGKDTVRTIRWEPAKIWVDVLEMPIYHLKSDKNQPNPQLYQAKAPQAVIGGNHMGAELQTGYTEINCPMQFFSKGIYIIGVEINGADYFTQKVLKTDWVLSYGQIAEYSSTGYLMFILMLQIKQCQE